MLNRKIRIPIMLLICLILLFSGLIINDESIKNLGIISYPHVSSYVQYIPFGF
jgi:hypothetical protein